MRFRTTLLLASTAVILGMGYYVYEMRGREAREVAAAAERRVVNFDPKEVREISIEKASERIIVRGEADRWRIVAPVDVPADPTTVDGLLSFIRRLEKVRSLDGAGDRAAVGLNAPEVRLGVGLRDGQTLTLLLGGPNPSRTGIYAAVEGAPLVFLAPTRLATELAKTPYVEELRDRTILPLDAERVRRLEIARAGVRVVVARVAPRRWRVERPFAGPGDDGIIRDLLWKIGSSRAHTVIRTPGPAAAYGFDRPHARVTITDDSGTARALIVVQSATNPHEVYIQLEGTRLVHVTENQLLADLAIAPEALRDRQLLVYDPRELERITIRYPRETLVLERAQDRWRVSQPAASEAMPSVVDNLLEVLPNLRYTTVEARSENGLRPYGLDPPRFALTLGLRGGRELPTVAIGRGEGGQHFAMVGGRDAVYTVDSRLVRVIPEEPADAKRFPLAEQLRRGLEKIEPGKR